MLQSLKTGDRVLVLNNQQTRSLESAEVLGRVGIFQRYSKPHGYAVVLFDNAEPGQAQGAYHLHPESLELVP